MRGYLIFICAVFVGIVGASSILSVYHQNDCDIKLERLIVLWYNNTIYKNLKAAFVPFNRTVRAVNASATILLDLNYDAKVQLQFYKFMSNEYRFFPITVSEDMCEHYARNSFNMAEMLKNVSNAHGCPWKKGYYYAHYATFDYSRFPPYMPHGSYMVDIKVYHQASYGFNIQSYHSVLEKPKQWKR